jgi:para-nitrobenzyl esterase
MKLRIGLAGLVAGLCVAASAEAASGPVVTLDTGKVVGQAADGYAVYRGIPYAAAPVGPLRWQPPAPAKAWSTLRDATQFGAVCPQVYSKGYTFKIEPTSEDCLFLNVWTPAKASAKPRPVMVWIHGGSWTIGSGSKPIYDGDAFAKDGVILVSINYRLGALGFFAHPALTAEAGPTAPLFAYGHMDQIAALQWVQRNIAAFGGDPKNVTVFGESAGAGSILHLMATPSAKGLFAKAIVESGPGFGLPKSLASQEAKGAEFAKAHGAPDNATAEQLRALPAEALMERNYDAAPFADGRLTPEPVDKVFREGRQMPVPLIIGSNSDEGSLVKEYAALPNQMRLMYGAKAAQLKALYGDETPDDTTLGRVLFADTVFGAASHWIAGKASQKAPTYLYRFTYVAENERPNVKGAYHAAELPFVFDTLDKSWIKPTANDQKIAAELHACWTGFAKHANHPCRAWKAYDRVTDQTLVVTEGGLDSVKAYRKAPYEVIESTLFERHPAAAKSGK